MILFYDSFYYKQGKLRDDDCVVNEFLHNYLYNESTKYRRATINYPFVNCYRINRVVNRSNTQSKEFGIVVHKSSVLVALFVHDDFV